LATGCASAPVNGDPGDDGGDDSASDSTVPGDGHAPVESGGHDAQRDSTPPAEASGDDGSGGDASDDASGDDGSQDAPPGETSTTDASDDTTGAQDSSTPVDSGVDAPPDAPPDVSGPGPITRVQSATQLTTSTATSLAVTFSKAHQAGDLIVIAVGWTDTQYHVNTVTDSAGNTYHLAVGPTLYGADLTQSIYYSAGIAASATGAKTTVTFNGAASAVDLRAAEYSGLTALDVTATASNKSTSASSGNATTTTGRELLFGAGMTNDGYTSAPTTGFTQIALTTNGDMFEDRIVSATGSYAATGTFMDTGSWEWVIQLATFR
jgi:hypothetical protein